MQIVIPGRLAARRAASTFTHGLGVAVDLRNPGGVTPSPSFVATTSSGTTGSGTSSGAAMTSPFTYLRDARIASGAGLVVRTPLPSGGQAATTTDFTSVNVSPEYNPTTNTITTDKPPEEKPADEKPADEKPPRVSAPAASNQTGLIIGLVAIGALVLLVTRK